MSHHKIEEDNELNEKSSMMVANQAKDDAPNNKKMKKYSGQEKEQNKKMFKGNCYICSDIGHKAQNSQVLNKNKKRDQINMLETTREIENLCDMITESNLVGYPNE